MEVQNLFDMIIFVLSVMNVLLSVAQRDWFAMGGWAVAVLAYTRILQLI